MADAILSVELTAKIDAFRDAFNKAIRETDNLNKNTKTKVAEIDKAFATLATQVEQSMARANNSTSSSSNSVSKNLAKIAASSKNMGGSVAQGSNQAAFALNNLGKVAQDAPFGFIGIQNNLNPLLESFQSLKVQTGSTSLALKALGSSLIGPAGLGIALSVVSSAVLFYQQYQQKANKTINDAKKNTDDYISTLSQLDQVQLKGAQSAQKELTSLQTLYSIATNTTISLKQRKEAVDELQKEYPKYFANLKDETILNGNAKSAYDSLTQSIIATARARAAQDLITKNSTRQLENEKKIIDLEKEQLKNQLEKNKAIARGNSLPSGSSTGGVSTNLSDLTRVSLAQEKINENLNLRRNLVTDTNRLTAENLRLTKAIVNEVKKGADLTNKTNTTTQKEPKALGKVNNGNILAQLNDANIKLGLNNVTTIKPIFKLEPQLLGLSEFQKIVNEAQIEIFRLLDTPNLVNTAAIALGNSFEAMGEAIASGKNILEAAGAVIQKTISDMLSALGSQFITMGAAKVAGGILAGPLGGKLIADGAGLIALGSGLKLGSGIIGGLGKGSSSKGGSNAPSQRRFGSTASIQAPSPIQYSGTSVGLNGSISSVKNMGSYNQNSIIPEVRIGNDAIYIAYKRGEKQQSRV